MELREAQLFKPLKKHFKDLGYAVYAEVPCFGRGVDFVAVKGNEHIAVEMKMYFNNEVLRQAHGNIISFGRSYIAYPTKKAVMIDPHDHDKYWALPERLRNKIDYCKQRGIGVIQIVGAHQIIFTAMEAVYDKPYRVFDFSQFSESESDEAGLPYQKGVSAGYYELEAIKAYVRAHPQADWREIYANVQNHYSSPSSLSGSMGQWRGFSLNEFKHHLALERLADTQAAEPTRYADGYPQPKTRA